MPKTADLEAACLARYNKKDCEALKIINEFRGFYKDDGICIVGPHGCDPVIYARDEAEKKKLSEPKNKSTGIDAPKPPIPSLTKHPLVDDESVPSDPNLISECYPLVKFRKTLDLTDLESWPGSDLV